MPYGNVSLVMRLFPLHPGYVMIVCAEATVAVATASSIDENILDMCVLGRWVIRGVVSAEWTDRRIILRSDEIVETKISFSSPYDCLYVVVKMEKCF
jgi:hypothetical protein